MTSFQTHHGTIPVAWTRRPINRQWSAGRAVVDGKFVHLRDIMAGEGDEFPDGRELAHHDGAHSVLTVPLIREGESVGVIILRRTEVLPFTDKQIALLKTFADQAVIAIENARLFNETQQALERQTATAEILRVIAGSPSDVQPVFEAIAESAPRVGGLSSIVTRVGDEFISPSRPETKLVCKLWRMFPQHSPANSGSGLCWPDRRMRYRARPETQPRKLPALAELAACLPFPCCVTAVRSERLASQGPNQEALMRMPSA